MSCGWYTVWMIWWHLLCFSTVKKSIKYTEVLQSLQSYIWLCFMCRKRMLIMLKSLFSLICAYPYCVPMAKQYVIISFLPRAVADIHSEWETEEEQGAEREMGLKGRGRKCFNWNDSWTQHHPLISLLFSPYFPFSPHFSHSSLLCIFTFPARFKM